MNFIQRVAAAYVARLDEDLAHNGDWPARAYAFCSCLLATFHADPEDAEAGLEWFAQGSVIR